MSVQKGRDLYADRYGKADGKQSAAMETGELMVKANRGDLEAKAEVRRRRPQDQGRSGVDPDGADVTPGL